MIPWAVQLITLLAVALGALASFVSTRLVDRSRWQREESLRWDGKRLECTSISLRRSCTILMWAIAWRPVLACHRL
jgi:hypothetical protein